MCLELFYPKSLNGEGIAGSGSSYNICCSAVVGVLLIITHTIKSLKKYETTISRHVFLLLNNIIVLELKGADFLRGHFKGRVQNR